jgi:hypothetical protein
MTSIAICIFGRRTASRAHLVAGCVPRRTLAAASANRSLPLVCALHGQDVERWRPCLAHSVSDTCQTPSIPELGRGPDHRCGYGVRLRDGSMPVGGGLALPLGAGFRLPGHANHLADGSDHPGRGSLPLRGGSEHLGEGRKHQFEAPDHLEGPPDPPLGSFLASVRWFGASRRGSEAPIRGSGPPRRSSGPSPGVLPCLREVVRSISERVGSTNLRLRTTSKLTRTTSNVLPVTLDATRPTSACHASRRDRTPVDAARVAAGLQARDAHCASSVSSARIGALSPYSTARPADRRSRTSACACASRARRSASAT